MRRNSNRLIANASQPFPAPSKPSLAAAGFSAHSSHSNFAGLRSSRRQVNAISLAGSNPRGQSPRVFWLYWICIQAHVSKLPVALRMAAAMHRE